MTTKRPVDWSACAEAIAAAIPRERLHPSVLEWASAPAHRRQTWGIAVSGGADSLALLLLIWAHWPEQRRRLRVLHFDHALRGRASTEDAQFCRRVANALKIECAVGRWDRPPGSAAPSEAAARVARFAFLQRRARALWFAHHQDDIAETLLMRLARGSGAAGLSAPRPIHLHGKGRVHLRPLLTVRKTELVAALRRAGAPWREDHTNGRPDYFRNRIRQTVVPAWAAAAQRDAIAGAARTRELLAEDDAALDAWAERIQTVSARGELLLGRLRGVPRAVTRRALHRWMQRAPVAVDVSRQAFDALLAAIEQGRPTRHSLGSQLFAVIDRGRVRFVAGKAGPKIHRPVN